jgi:hypothetical protein
MLYYGTKFYIGTRQPINEPYVWLVFASRSRFRAAWLVLIGKADAVVWE